jgi:HEAT repeat protein
VIALALALALTAAPPGRAPADPAASGAAATLEPEAREAAIRSYLGALDRPVTAEAWRALGPDAVPTLRAVAGDPRELPTRRTLALEGLAALGGAEAEAVHLAALRAPGTPRLVRHGAIRGLGALLPADRLAREVRPLLGDRDPGARATAAEVLAAGSPARACAAIRAQAAHETGLARARFSKALERCSR